MNLDEAFDVSAIQLEPRLQEYLRRKKFNEENDIEPPIPEEQEFCITEFDMKMLKRFRQGKKKLYSSKRLAKDPHFVEPLADNFSMSMEHDFKKDPRYKRLQKKLESHKKAQREIRNFEGIDEDYTIFHQSNPYDLKPEQKPKKISKPYDDPDNDNSSDDEMFHGELMMDSRDLMLGRSRPIKSQNQAGARDSFDSMKISRDLSNNSYCYSPNRKSANPNSYHHPPRIAYKQYVMPQRVDGGLEHSRNVSDIIGNLDSYNKHLNETYEYIQSDVDLDTKTFTPGTRTNTRREMPSCYQSVPFMYGNGLADVSLEDSLRGGIRDSSKKSVGFRNPFEHSFSYISEDISDPNHTVQMWPQNSRGQNKEIARPNSIALKSERRIRRNKNLQ